ncbi:signaling mucin MSB2 [Biomphalaria pfeifferi]|uniref:Signaling mucin MSB2 n=1 Tax=Biomphalaria pfeifferi TaxID=112525 RepID=A0AAD8FPJ0_BIOPF|nr:signaling mucin MSB2 [Biomphalaria pfeifferi]
MMKRDTVLFSWIFIYLTRCEIFTYRSCPDGWTLLNSKCYTFNTGWNEWSDASRKCSDQTAHLIIIESIEEMRSVGNYLQHLYSTTTLWWTGLKREGLTGDNWNWLDGSDVNESVTKWTDTREITAFGDLAAALILTYSPVFLTSMLRSTKVPSVCQLKNTILSDVTCSEGWTKLDTHCYLFVPVQKTWLNGRKFCNDMNSEIACISSPAVYETLQKHLVHTYSNLKRWWLGLSWNESQTPSNWKWLDGSDLDTAITPWTDPSQSVCLGLTAGLAEMTSNKLFLRTESMTSLEHFICQRPLDQETTTMTPVAATTEATTSSGKITLDTNIISVTTGTRETTTALTTTTSVITSKSETTSTRVTNTTSQAESTTKLETNTSKITTTPETNISNITTSPETNISNITTIPETKISNITTIPETNISNITTTPVTNTSKILTTPKTHISNTTTPETKTSKVTTSPETNISNITTIPETNILKTTTTPETNILKTTTTPETNILKTTTTPDTNILKTTTTPETNILKTTTTPETNILKTTTTPETNTSNITTMSGRTTIPVTTTFVMTSTPEITTTPMTTKRTITISPMSTSTKTLLDQGCTLTTTLASSSSFTMSTTTTKKTTIPAITNHRFSTTPTTYSLGKICECVGNTFVTCNEHVCLFWFKIFFLRQLEKSSKPAKCIYLKKTARERPLEIVFLV